MQIHGLERRRIQCQLISTLTDAGGMGYYQVFAVTKTVSFPLITSQAQQSWSAALQNV
jgi:hypothetical protein